MNRRRVTPKRIELLRESIAEVGDLRRYFPVLEDEDGNVVDGHVRRAYDPAWPAAEKRVPCDVVATVYAAANRANPWTVDHWEILRANHAVFVRNRKAAAVEHVRLAALRGESEQFARDYPELVEIAERSA